MIVAMLAMQAGIPSTAWITLGGSVAVASIGGVVALMVRLIRGPIQVQDLWAENAKLRDRLEKLDVTVQKLIAGRETQLNINRTLGEGFDALSNYVEREAELAGHPPRFTLREQQAIEKARALREDEDIWAATAPS